MSTTVKRILIGIGAFVLLFAGYVSYQFMTTKNHSPEKKIAFTSGDWEVSVFYNRPYKKERVIFGELVPYGEVWRTGANEATTFTTNQDLLVEGQPLKAGTYTLWTIPQQDAWTVIFNEKSYDWGVKMEDFKPVASREADGDVLQVIVPVTALTESLEQFTITLEGESSPTMVLAWDQTQIEVAIAKEGAEEPQMAVMPQDSIQ
ncbi:MAG: DUF2911 domain-containing protein [Bacteroidota bacterium]